MKYALLIYTKPGVWETLSQEEQAAAYQVYGEIQGTAGIYAGAQLQPVETATTVRVQDGETLSTDGPFPDTKEALAGYYLIEADDLDAASSWPPESRPRASAARSRCVRCSDPTTTPPRPEHPL